MSESMNNLKVLGLNSGVFVSPEAINAYFVTNLSIDWLPYKW